MTTTSNEYKLSREFIQGTTDRLKDKLCRIYRSINNSKHEYINFDSYDGIFMGAVQVTGYSYSETFINRFLHNLDLIKELVDNQPTKSYVFLKFKRNEESEAEVFELDKEGYKLSYTEIGFTHKTFRLYEESELNWRVHLFGRYHTKTLEIKNN